MPNPFPPAAAVGALAALIGHAPAGQAAIIPDRPDAIVCSVSDPTGVLPWDELVFYISAHTRNGGTLYKTLTSDPVVLIVDEKDIVKGDNLANCDGRSLKALREEGRAVDLTKGPARSR